MDVGTCVHSMPHSMYRASLESDQCFGWPGLGVGFCVTRLDCLIGSTVCTVCMSDYMQEALSSTAASERGEAHGRSNWTGLINVGPQGIRVGWWQPS
jgi:hypothetical protein